MAGGFGPLVAPQTTIRPSDAHRRERRLPGRLADVLDDDVHALAAGRLLHRRRHVAGRVVDDGVGAELARPLELRRRSTR